MISLGMALATFVLRREARREGLDPRAILDVAIMVLPGAWIGSRLLHLLLVDPDFLWTDPWKMFEPRGGYVFLGGVVCAVGLVVLRARRLSLPLWKVADVFAPALPFGIIFGRLGCLGAGCCHGRHASWPTGTDVPWAIEMLHPAVRVDPALLGVPIHPSPVYESLLGLGLFLWISLRKAGPRFEGQSIAEVFIGYGIGRFVLEFFRGDAGRGFPFDGVLSTSQWLGIMMAAGAALVYWRRRKQCIPSS